MDQAEKKRLLKTRERINKKRPHFKRFESWRFVRIKDQWRKPRGIDNHMRTEESGWPKSVKVGYRGPAAVRGLHSSGMEEVMVWNTKELMRPMIEDFKAGTFAPAKFYSVGVADDGLLVDINPNLADDISAEAMALYEQRLQEIKDGTFEVPFIMEG